MGSPLDRIGHRVGPFQLVEWIGSAGGVAEYRAVRPGAAREPVEVAVRLPERPGDEEAAARLRREYELLREMDDPRVPRAHGWYAAEAALALSWTGGVTIAEVLRAWRRRLVPHDAPTAVDVALEVVHALGHLHAVFREAEVHGNLVPGRVWLGPGGDVLVTGFGDEPGTDPDAYPAPEREAGAFQDARTDQWDCAALAVELLTGQRPRADEAERAEPAAPLARIGRRWPELEGVLRRALAPAAGDRWPRFGQFVRALDEAARTVGGTPDRAGLAERVFAVLGEVREGHVADAPEGPAQPASLSRSEAPEEAPAPPAPRADATAADAPSLTPVEVSGEPDSAPAGAPAISVGDRSLPGVDRVELSYDAASGPPPGARPPSVEVDAGEEVADPMSVSSEPTEPAVPSGGGAVPLPRFQWTEIAGFAAGGLLLLAAAAWLLARLW